MSLVLGFSVLKPNCFIYRHLGGAGGGALTRGWKPRVICEVLEEPKQWGVSGGATGGRSPHINHILSP